MLYWLYQVIKIPLLLALPFVLLIRGAVYLHTTHHFLSHASLLGGAIGAIIVLIIYLSFMHGRVTGKVGGKKALKRRSVIAMILVLGYCVHGLFFLSSKNAKVSEVKKEYTSLHPIIRLGGSTLVFMDPDVIMTDASRQPEDYKKMGLASKKRSLHYKQSNGYAHAFDIRTNGRSELRNSLMKTYFTLMGFNTLRHGGTGDHLHVSLYSKDHPGAI